MVIESQVARVGVSDGGSPRRATDRTALTVGFVNNMPDAAFEDTYRQFAGLLGAGAHGFAVNLRGYRLPHVPRSESVLSAASLRYEDAACLYAHPPDALIVTGLEPRLTDLAAEPYWEDLAHLLRWAEATVPSTILSCLASHAAALALDGISRHLLPSKQSGVFRQEVDADHPLGTRLERVVSLPHSRYNDIPASALNARYRLVVASPLSGWSVATRQAEERVLVLLQGHPEYGPLTLLKEYRRDVRRYFEGVLPAHPAIPSDYLDATGIELLESFRARCESQSGAPLEEFPHKEAAKHVDFRWKHTSKRLFTNWIEDAATRSAPAAS
jgi:homoserine O-succinyltransferase/O-acetyltransferase